MSGLCCRSEKSLSCRHARLRQRQRMPEVRSAKQEGAFGSWFPPRRPRPTTLRYTQFDAIGLHYPQSDEFSCPHVFEQDPKGSLDSYTRRETLTFLWRVYQPGITKRRSIQQECFRRSLASGPDPEPAPGDYSSSFRPTRFHEFSPFLLPRTPSLPVDRCAQLPQPAEPLLSLLQAYS